jgi:hypothetical protein
MNETFAYLTKLWINLKKVILLGYLTTDGMEITNSQYCTFEKLLFSGFFEKDFHSHTFCMITFACWDDNTGWIQ